MKRLYEKVEELVVEAILNGMATEEDVCDYVHSFVSENLASNELIINLADIVYGVVSEEKETSYPAFH